MRFRQNTVEFLSLCGALVFFALFFYQTTNNIYRIDGTFMDFSLAGWAAMLALWGAGLWRYFKQRKAGVLIFAVQAAVVCYAFDCWRLFIYAADLMMKPYILGLVAAEAAVFLIAARGRYKPAALNALAAGLVIFFGYYIMYPILLPLPATMAIAVLLSLIYPLALGTAKVRKAAIGVLAAALIIPGGVLIDGWLNAPGIRFYERGVAKPVENVKVSVVVPVYNAEKYLERCLDSLRKQTLKDIEIICVNDGSTDGSGDILAEYAAHDKRFKVITQENQYVGAARNRGIEAARGEYVGFVDNDDWVSPNYFEDLYNAAKKYNTDIAIAAQSDVVILKEKSRLDDLLFDSFAHISNTQHHLFDIGLRIYLRGKQFINSSDLASATSIGMIWDKIFRRDFLNKYNLRLPTARALGEDVYFFYTTGVYVDKVAIAQNAVYYQRRGDVTAASGYYVKPNIEEFKQYQALLNFYDKADLPAENAKLWREDLVHYLHYIFYSRCYESSPSDAAILLELLREFLPEVNLDTYNQKGLFDEISAKHR